AGRVRASGPELAFERLGQGHRHLLLRVAPQHHGLTWLDRRPGELLVHVGGRLKVPGDDGREAVADPAQWADAREKGEQRRRGRGPEAEALALVHEAAVRIAVPDPERARGRVSHAHDRLQLPG